MHRKEKTRWFNTYKPKYTMYVHNITSTLFYFIENKCTPHHALSNSLDVAEGSSTSALGDQIQSLKDKILTYAKRLDSGVRVYLIHAAHR